jgi:arsenical pump membrane protein
MLPAWLTACAITAAFVCASFALDGGSNHATVAPPPIRVRVGAAATLVAALLVVLLPNPAVPVLVVGLLAITVQRLRPRLDARVLALLFVVAVSLGTLARLWHGPASLLDSSGVWGVAGIGAAASLVLNNLPATVLLTGHAPAHPSALLLGLDLGPNLAVTGSLSAVLWIQAARSVGARPSIVTYTRLGLVLVPLTLVATVALSSWA